MAKAKTTAFFCKECGYESSKWLGQCPACRAWNTLVEEPVAGTVSAAGKGRMSSDRGAGRAVAKPALLSEIRLEQEDRISTGFKELDRVLGDGIVAGSLVLENQPFCCRYAAIWQQPDRRYFIFPEKSR